MADLKRRLKSLENQMGMSKGATGTRLVLIHPAYTPEEQALPEVEQWLTYQQAITKHRGDKFALILLSPQAEVEARAEQLKATKNNQTAESRAAI
jgi:hypothetical protein